MIVVAAPPPRIGRSWEKYSVPWRMKVDAIMTPAQTIEMATIVCPKRFLSSAPLVVDIKSTRNETSPRILVQETILKFGNCRAGSCEGIICLTLLHL
jgi:hypothetical protein